MKALLILLTLLILGGVTYYVLSVDPGLTAEDDSKRPLQDKPVPGDVAVARNTDPVAPAILDGERKAEPSRTADVQAALSSPQPPPAAVEPIRFETDQLRELAETTSAASTKGATILDYHRKIESEARDQTWSYRTEAEINDAIAQRSASGAVRVERAECRTTLCEVQLSQPSQGGSSELSAAVNELQEYSASKGYRMQNSSTVHSLRLGTGAAIMIFERSP